MSLMSRIADAFKSLTSNSANEDAPAGVPVPPPDSGAIPMPDREPVGEHTTRDDVT